MVKIKMREQMGEQQSRKKLILPIFLGLIMVMSIFGFIIGQSTQDNQQVPDGGKTFGGHVFQRVNAGWVTTIDGREVIFRYLPDELSDIDISSIPSDALKKPKIYLSRDPRQSYGLAERDIYHDLKPVTNLQLACGIDSEECKNVPLKTCKDADAMTAVILFALSEGPSIAFENNCVSISGDAVHITKVMDKLLYSYFGIAG